MGLNCSPNGIFDWVTVGNDAATGRQRWESRYNGARSGIDIPVAISATPDGSRVFVTGVANWSFETVGGDYFGVSDAVTVAYDGATGQELWEQTHIGNTIGQAAPAAISSSADGSTVYVAGSEVQYLARSAGGSLSPVASPTPTTFVAAYDATDGHQEWLARQVGAAGTWSIPAALSVSGTTVVVTGSLSAAGRIAITGTAYAAATGQRLWSQVFQDAAADIVPTALATGSGLAVIAGVRVVSGLSPCSIQHPRDTGESDLLTVAYDLAGGALRWSSTYAASTSPTLNFASAVTLSPDGHTVFTTGTSSGPSDDCARHVVTLALDSAAGTRRWLADEAQTDRYLTNPYLADALVVSPDGATLYDAMVDAACSDPIICSASSVTSADFVLVAYDAASGAATWRAEYNHCAATPEVDDPAAVFLSTGTDMVFVTGSFSSGSGCPEDGGHAMGTIAYATGVGAASGGPASASTMTGSEPAAQAPGPWVEANGLSPPARSGAAIADDQATGQVVLYGGCCDTLGPLDDTWTRSAQGWNEHRGGPNPGARQAASMAADPATGQVILFGGLDHSSSTLGDTWAWDGQTWSELHPALSPAPRSGATMAYDAARRQLVLFGGCCADGLQPYADTWVWDGATWSPRTGVAPPGRLAATMAYDEHAGNVVLFGGRACTAGSCTALADTWVWDGQSWQQRQPSQSPPARTAATMAYDPGLALMVLASGTADPYGTSAYTPKGNLTDTWTWDGTTWTQSSTSPPLHAAAMAYDHGSGALVVIGGFTSFSDTYPGHVVPLVGGSRSSDEWSFDGAGWRLDARSWPQPRVGGAMAYSEATQQDVLFGGCCRDASQEPRPLGDTWTWDGTSWKQHTGGPAPPARLGAGMSDDPPDHTVVLFGGCCQTDPVQYAAGTEPGTTTEIGYEVGTPFADTWTWDGTAWLLRHPAHSPPARVDSVLAFDPVSGHVLLFGGCCDSSGSALADTWTWDGTDWTQQQPTASPPGRMLAAAATDPSSGIVLFGGKGGSVFGAPFGDTWTWSGATWVEHSTTVAPPPRSAAGAAFSPGLGGTVLFGGTPSFTDCAFQDSWVWAAGRWQQLDAGTMRENTWPERGRCADNSAGRPASRMAMSVASGPDGSMMVFGGGERGGGNNADMNADDLWFLGASPTANVPEFPLPFIPLLLGGFGFGAYSRRRRRRSTARPRKR